MTDFEIEELIRGVINLDDDLDSAEVEDALFAETGVSLLSFKVVAELLIDFAHKSESPLTCNKYLGFADHNKSVFLAKKEPTNENE